MGSSDSHLPGRRVAWTLPGTYVTMGPGGFAYHRREEPVPNTPPRLVEQGGGELPTASVAELIQSSPDWFVSDAQARLRRIRWILPYAVLAGILLLATAQRQALFFPLLLALAAGSFFLHRWDRARRTTRIIYDVDNPEIVQRLVLATEVARQLAGCSRLWHIYYAVATSDWKRNAGASTLLKRTVTRCAPGALPLFEMNIDTWCVPIGPQRLLFLPDRLLVWDGQHLAALPYEQLQVRARATSFIEERGEGPPDGRIVDTTWRYVRRDGGPDRRFNNNAELPIMEYGELELVSPGGLRLVLQTSTLHAALTAANAFESLGRRALPAPIHAAPAQPLPAPVPIAQALLSAPSAPSAPSAQSMPHPLPAYVPRARSIAVLMRYLAAADRRIDDAEIALAAELLTRLLPTDPDLRELTSQFRDLPSDSSSVSAALRDISNGGNDYRIWVRGALESMANADGKTTPKEAERLQEIRSSLSLR